MAQMTGLAGEIEAAIGLEATVTLLRARGGTRIEIPVRAAGSALAAIPGTAAAQAMVDAFGAGKLDLPAAGLRGVRQIMAQRRAEAEAALKAGASLREAAMLADVTERSVRRFRADLDDDDGQQSLPFD